MAILSTKDVIHKYKKEERKFCIMAILRLLYKEMKALEYVKWIKKTILDRRLYRFGDSSRLKFAWTYLFMRIENPLNSYVWNKIITTYSVFVLIILYRYLYLT